MVHLYVLLGVIAVLILPALAVFLCTRWLPKLLQVVLVSIVGFLSVCWLTQAVPGLLTAIQRSNAKRAVRELREMAGAIERLHKPTGYPTISSVSELNRLGSAHFTAQDGWGSPYVIVASGNHYTATGFFTP